MVRTLTVLTAHVAFEEERWSGRGERGREMLLRQCEYCSCQLGHLSGDVSEEHSIEMLGARRSRPLSEQSTLSQVFLPGVRNMDGLSTKN